MNPIVAVGCGILIGIVMSLGCVVKIMASITNGCSECPYAGKDGSTCPVNKHMCADSTNMDVAAQGCCNGGNP